MLPIKLSQSIFFTTLALLWLSYSDSLEDLVNSSILKDSQKNIVIKNFMIVLMFFNYAKRKWDRSRGKASKQRKRMRMHFNQSCTHGGVHGKQKHLYTWAAHASSLIHRYSILISYLPSVCIQGYVGGSTIQVPSSFVIWDLSEANSFKYSSPATTRNRLPSVK